MKSKVRSRRNLLLVALSAILILSFLMFNNRGDAKYSSEREFEKEWVLFTPISDSADIPECNCCGDGNVPVAKWYVFNTKSKTFAPVNTRSIFPNTSLFGASCSYVVASGMVQLVKYDWSQISSEFKYVALVLSGPNKIVKNGHEEVKVVY
jgi:hypothetical protein